MRQTSFDQEALLAEAVRYHQAGRLKDAERLYRQILVMSPRNAFALHLLGVLAHQTGQSDVAIELIMQAVTQNSGVPAFHVSLGNARMAQGQSDEAIACYRRALSLQPNLAEAHCNLGGALAQQGKLDESVANYRKALNLKPDYAKALGGLGNALKTQGKLEEAVASYRRLLIISPGDAGGHNNLGIALKMQGKSEEAALSYRQAVALQPRMAEAHNNLGILLAEQGKTDEAVAVYRQALACNPTFADAHLNLGSVLAEQGKAREAEVSYREALKARPNYAEAHNNLGTTLAGQGRTDEAIDSYRCALACKPDFATASCNLAALFNGMGEHRMATEVIRHCLQQNETLEAKRAFVLCAKHCDSLDDDDQSRALMIRALSETWGRPSELAYSAVAMVMRNNAICGCVTRAITEWPGRPCAQLLLNAPGFGRLVTDPLLRAMLVCVPVCNNRLERYLTMMRHALLETAEALQAGDDSGDFLPFFCALAQQCFINDYVFCLTRDEFERAKELADRLAAALQAAKPVPAAWVAAVASYFPLASLASAARLLEMKWCEEIRAVLVQQITEPEEETRERSGIDQLTEIDDAISMLVRNQYEESPFPRWVRAAPAGAPKTLTRYLSDKFPLAAFRCPARGAEIAILIAGCGTGRHAIETALQIQNARVTAIDLSLNSLGYARRKTRELGLDNITYAQADLLKLNWSDAGFDVIEAVGVLHHLADPWSGWKKLLTLLQPGGFMNVALYSELGRRQVAAIRKLISEGDYGSTPGEIRRFRQDLMDRDADFRRTTESLDFCTLSMCRDLLFHVQEHRLTLPQIGAFLRDNDLKLLGFELDMGVFFSYRRRFPNDASCTDLAQWTMFEQENPNTFSGMYNFWIQKPG